MMEFNTNHRTEARCFSGCLKLPDQGKEALQKLWVPQGGPSHEDVIFGVDVVVLLQVNLLSVCTKQR